MSWLSCRLRPSGHPPPGDGGPGGGGGGGGGCQGPGCNNEDDCGSEIYWTCDEENNGTAVCTSRSFDYTEIPGVNLEICDFPDSFKKADTEGNLKTWYRESAGGQATCNANCGTLCTGYVCNGPPVNSDFTAFNWPCDKATVESYILFDCTDDVNKCPLNDCDGRDGKRYYQDPNICQDSEPDCKGGEDDGGGGETLPGSCWECPSSSPNKGPCTELCTQIWDIALGEWVCPEFCFAEKADCNAACPKTCWDCNEETEECVENDYFYTDECTYESADQLKCDTECDDSDPCDYTCTRWYCIDGGCTWDNDNSTWSDCVDSETVSDPLCDPPTNTTDANCDGTTGDYESNDSYFATKKEALDDDCVTCEAQYTCTPGSGQPGAEGQCEDNCTGTFDSDDETCDYGTKTCYSDPGDCYQNAPSCDCDDIVVCHSCISSQCDDTCTVCEATNNGDGTCSYKGALGGTGICAGLSCFAFVQGKCAYKGSGALPTCKALCMDNALDDYCYECPGDGTDCCTKTCKGETTSAPGGDTIISCPSDKNCFTTKDACDLINNCKKECWWCDPGGPVASPGGECKKIDVDCEFLTDGDCTTFGAATYYNSEPDCQGAGCGSESNWNNNETAQQLVYGYDYVDSVYERNLSNRKYYMYNSPFVPVERGNLPADLFKERVHASVYAVYNMNKDSNMLFSDFAYTNLNNTNLEKSLNGSLVTLINEVKLATGKSIKPQILGTIRNLLISDRLSSLDVNDLIRYLTNIKNIQDDYSDTRGETGIPGTHGSEATALKMAGEKAYSLLPKYYEGAVKERMRLWKTIATDLNKNIPITLSDGTASQLYYSVSDTVVVGSGTLTMSPGDIQKITSSDGSIISLPVAGDQDRAQILKIEDLQKIMYLLGDEYSISMNVKTDETLRMDERYSVSGHRADSYMLTLEVSTITDLPRTNSFVANTQANYTFQNKQSVKTNWVQDYPWPYMVFYVDSDDPIFNYITNDGTITVTTKDFTADLFENDPTLNIYPRRIPTTIVLIPTNLDKYVPNHVVSTQGDYGERNLKFIMNADPKLSDSWEPPYLKQTYEYTDEVSAPNDIAKFSSVSYNFDADNMASLKRYTNDIEVLPRPIFGVKEVLTTLQEFKENWILPDNTVNWPQVFENIPRSKMKDLYNECSNWEKLRSKLGLGKVSTNDTVNKKYPKVRDVRSNNKKITDPDYDTYIRVVQKPIIDIQPPPGPL